MPRYVTHVEAVNEILAQKGVQESIKKMGLVGVTLEFKDCGAGQYYTMFRFGHEKFDPTPDLTYGFNPYFKIPWSSYPGCCGVRIVYLISESTMFRMQPGIVSTAANRDEVYPPIGRRGVATTFWNVFVKALKLQKNVGLLVGEITEKQNSGRAWAEKMGWKPVGEPFRNPNTKNMIQSYEYRLTTKNFDEGSVSE
jgi:hypothetical protein